MNVAFYGRVSTVKQAERDLSLPDQDDQVQAWCDGNNHTIVAKYVDAGKSAMDGNRPEFKRMIDDALSSPPPFNAIVVHSLSRFFRDQTELMWHVKQLRQNGVTLLSVTQITSDDFTGEMITRLIAMFDEYSSRENAKHVLRTMLKNAEDGFFNGSRVPFGYKTVELPIKATKGRFRKKLEIDADEAIVVKRVFDIYTSTDQGIKEIVTLLNTEGYLRRGKPWSTATMHKMLSSTVYIGRKLFNQKHWRSGEKKANDEIVVINVPAIISEEMFILAAKRRLERSPEIIHPRVLTSQHLLTGLLKCGLCGASMVMATGKNNTYFYYRCTTKTKHGAKLCSSKDIPMGKLDKLVLDALASQVLTPERVITIIRELKKRLKNGGGDTLVELGKQLEVITFKLRNLYKAISEGVISTDDAILAEELEALKQQKSEVAVKIDGAARSESVALQSIDKPQVNNFTDMMQKRLMDTTTKFPKEYLRLLVKEVVVTGSTVRLIGDSTKLACAVKVAADKKKLSSPDEVLSFNKDWRARRDSNPLFDSQS
jgi:site-specific DNA recombinase